MIKNLNVAGIHCHELTIHVLVEVKGKYHATCESSVGGKGFSFLFGHCESGQKKTGQGFGDGLLFI